MKDKMAHAKPVVSKSIGNGGKLLVPQGGRDSSSMHLDSNEKLRNQVGGSTSNLSDTLGNR